MRQVSTRSVYRAKLSCRVNHQDISVCVYPFMWLTAPLISPIACKTKFRHFNSDLTCNRCRVGMVGCMRSVRFPKHRLNITNLNLLFLVLQNRAFQQVTPGLYPACLKFGSMLIGSLQELRQRSMRGRLSMEGQSASSGRRFPSLLLSLTHCT